MKHLYLLFLSMLLISCSSGNEEKSSSKMSLKEWKTPNGKVKVLSTIAMINDIVKEVGNDYVDSLVLIQEDLDPHSYQLVKGDDEKFSYADVVFFNGLGLEHGPSLQRYLYSNDKAIGLGDKIAKNDSEKILYYNNQLDPHVWMDISLWSEIVPIIVDTLSKKDPMHSEQYRQNGQKISEKMNKVHREVVETLSKIPMEKRYLVTSHDAFNYFVRAYFATEEERLNNDWQKRFAAPEVLAPESQLSANDIRAIIGFLQNNQISVIFPESNVSKDSIHKILSAGKEKGLNLKIAQTVLYGDAMGPKGSNADTYLKMIQHNAAVIEQYLNEREF